MWRAETSKWFQDLSVRTEEGTRSYQKQPRGRELSLVARGVRKGFLEEAAPGEILRGKSGGDLLDQGLLTKVGNLDLMLRAMGKH